MHDADAHAADIYMRAGHYTEDPPGPVALARGLGLRVVARQGVRAAILSRGTCEILTAPSLSPDALTWLVAHEVAEWHLEGYDAPDRERVCDSVAAALVLPRVAFASALAFFGPLPVALPALAKAFYVSQSVAGLRIGEVTGRPVALVTPNRVHVRGDDWIWPLRNISRDIRKAVSQHPGAAAHPLSDAPRRSLIVVGS